MAAAALVDTNVLVYLHDPREPAKQARAAEVLERGIREGNLVVPYQAVVEFVAATTRGRRGSPPLLEPEEAGREGECRLLRHDLLWPDLSVVRTAILGAHHHRLPWYDALIWAFAEVHGIPTILSEDFDHGARYGGVRIVDPFLDLNPPQPS